MYKVKTLVKKTIGLVLSTLVAFGVTAGTMQTFAYGSAETVKQGALEKNSKTAKKLNSQLITNSSERQSHYEYTDVGLQEPYMKDAELHVYSVKDDNGSPAAEITITHKNVGGFCPQLSGFREYTAVAKEGWVFKNWTHEQLFNGKDRGNYKVASYPFSKDHEHKTTAYTSGSVISVNRTSTIGETAFKKRIYKIYANLNPTITATAGEGGSISPTGKTEVQYGENQKYDFTADAGYVIDSLKIDGVKQTVEHKASSSYEFKAVKSPHKIEVSFVKVYTVTYTDGVAGEEIFADQVHKNVLVGTSTPAFEGGDPSRKGYEFKGWNPTVASTVTADATYVAQWKKDPFTVTFKDDNKTNKTVKVEAGKAIDTDVLTDQSMPNDPTKAGSTFKEWNTQQDGQGTTFTGTTPVNNNLTVYAIYTKDSKAKDSKKQDPKKQDPKQSKSPTPLTSPQPKTPAPKQPETPPTPKPKTPSSKPEPVSSVQHYKSEPAVLDTQEAEVLHGKMKYEADDTLPYNTQKKISDPVDGLKITTHTGSFVNGKWVPRDKVEITPAKDGLTKVGNKQVTHEGNKTITTTYDVDPDTGELTNPKKHTSMLAGILIDPSDNPNSNPGSDPNDNDGGNNGVGNNNNNNVSANGNVNAKGSVNASANGDDSTSGSNALQPVGARSANALSNTGSNISGTTFASFGALVLGLFVASGATVNRKRAKHLR